MHIYAQIVNDIEAKTVAAASTIKAKSKCNMETAEKIGKEIAEKAKKPKLLK